MIVVRAKVVSRAWGSAAERRITMIFFESVFLPLIRARSAARNAAETALRRKAFHHQTGPAASDVRDDCRAAMNFRDRAQIDREGKLYGSALAQSQIRRLDKYTACAQIAGAAEFAFAARSRDENDSAGAVSSVETSLHNFLYPYR